MRLQATDVDPLSRPAELPRQPLAERYVSLSTHTAPIKQTPRSSRNANVQTEQAVFPRFLREIGLNASFCA